MHRLLPLDKRKGKTRNINPTTERSPALGPATPRVAPSWGEWSAQDIVNTTWFKNFCPHVLLSSWEGASRAGGELWPPACRPGSFPKGTSPALGFAEIRLLTLTWQCCLTCGPQSCPTARWYFMTASLEEFGITSKWTEENPPCKQDIVLKQLVPQVHQVGASMVSLIEISRTFEEEGWKQGSWENKCSFF